jgi:hypothetical protein
MLQFGIKVKLQAITTTEFHVVICRIPTLDQVQWVLIAQCAARLFLCTVSTLINEMRVPSLPVTPSVIKLLLSLLLVVLPVCYSFKYSRNKPYMKTILIMVRIIQ